MFLGARTHRSAMKRTCSIEICLEETFMNSKVTIEVIKAIFAGLVKISEPNIF